MSATRASRRSARRQAACSAITLAGNASTAKSRASSAIRVSANTRMPGMIEAITMNNAELIKELRIAAHALELDNPRYPSAYIVSLLDQAADALISPLNGR